MEKVKELVAEYEDVFKTEECPFGQIGLTECRLRMKPGTKPVSDGYPLPRVHETLDKMAGKKYFSTLDASAAYWTIPMEKESKEYTAFSTPWGLYQFLVMPFGLCSAGAVYSRFYSRFWMRE